MDEAASEQQCGPSPSFSPPWEVREPAREDSDLAERKPMRSLHALLRKQGWRHRAKAAKVGHTVTDDQIRGALAFLTSPTGG